MDRTGNIMPPNLGVFAENGVSGASHGARLRKVLLKKSGFLDASLISVSRAGLGSTLLALVKLVFKYRYPPSLISARFLSSATEARHLKLDTFYMDTLHLSFMVDHMDASRCIVSLHNYDPEYFLELGRHENAFFKKCAYIYESLMSKLILNKIAKSPSTELWTLTSKDRDSVSVFLGKSVNLKVVPHLLPVFGTKQSLNITQSIQPCFDLIFIGVGSHQPNREALDFILKILNYDDRFRAHILGPSWQDQPYPRVKYYGFIENLDSFLSEKFIFVCPVFSGSGINMKIFSAIEFGLPGVLSRFTHEPFKVYGEGFPDEKYDVVDGKDPESWARAIVKKSELLSRGK
jgi:glycosyltransferase involved in cell wall biosynthesis